MKIDFNSIPITRSIARIVHHAEIRAGARNAAYCVADQITTPALMIFGAPFLLSRMGFEQFGVWMLVLALTGSLSVFNFGLGDATIKFISQCRGKNDVEGMNRTFRVNLVMGTALGLLAAGAMLFAAPLLARLVFSAGPATLASDVRAVRIGGMILALRSVESILSNTLRAFEEYAAAAQVSICVKAGTVGSAIALVERGHSVCAILEATAACVAAGIVAYTVRVVRVFPEVSFRLELDRLLWRKISSFGVYSWLQSLAAVMFGQADKLIIGAWMGAAAAGRYSICAQLAGVVHLTTAAAFGFLFPQFSRRHEAGEAHKLERMFRWAMATNWAVTAALTLPLVLGGREILTLWLGREFADQSYVLLAVLAVGYGWLSINVVPYVALLGLGKIRFACAANIAAGCVSIVASVLLLPHFGLVGAGLGRIAYGAVVTLCYFEAARILPHSKLPVAAWEPVD